MKNPAFNIFRLFLIAICFSLACNTPHENEDTPLADSSIEAENNAPDQPVLSAADTVDVQVEEAFFNDPLNLGNEVNKRLTGMGFTMEKELFPNRHVEGQTDTIYHYRRGAEYFKVYQAPGKSMLMEADIHSPDFVAGNGLKTGMATDEVLNRLNAGNSNPNAGVIRVHEETLNQVLMLNMQNSRIASMHLKLYVD